MNIRYAIALFVIILLTIFSIMHDINTGYVYINHINYEQFPAVVKCGTVEAQGHPSSDATFKSYDEYEAHVSLITHAQNEVKNLSFVLK